MPINFVICRASLELFFGRKNFKQTKLTLLQEHVHAPRQSDPGQVDSENPASTSTGKRSRSDARDWSDVRPDTVHFCLLSLHDSILNKEGRIHVYVETLDGRLYKISSGFRVPRTFKVFNKVFANFLHSKSKTLKTEAGEVLVERLDQSLDELVPEGATTIAIDNKAPRADLRAFLADLSPNLDGCWFFISASPSRSPESIAHSDVVEVASVHKRLLARAVKRSSHDPGQLDALEAACLAHEPVEVPPPRYTHSLSVRPYSVSCLANCYTLVSTLESVLSY